MVRLLTPGAACFLRLAEARNVPPRRFWRLPGMPTDRSDPECVLELRALLLLIGWFAEQAVRWFPPGVDWFVREVMRVAHPLGRHA